MKRKVALIAPLVLAISISTPVNACTRVLYEAGGGTFVVGRTMDWFGDTQTDLWAFPRGMKRDGGAGEGSISWTSRHGSIVCSMYDLASVDGMNDAGLVGNVLYLVEADYGDPEASRKPRLSIGAWLQYVLDNYGTVQAAVEALRAEPFALVAPVLPDGNAASGHLALSDASGDSAILEYLEGKLVIHHGPQYRVMTNSPPYDRQLALNACWEEIGGRTMLPGTHRASDRFARASYNLKATPRFDDPSTAIAAVFSMMRTISVPLGIQDPERPNLASTRWRTVANSKTRRYFFESTLSPSIFWVDLDLLDLSDGASPVKLELGDNPILAGEVSRSFVPPEPFKFLSH